MPVSWSTTARSMVRVGQHPLHQHPAPTLADEGHGLGRAVLRAVPVHDLLRGQGKVEFVSQGVQFLPVPHQNGVDDAVPAGGEHRLQRVSVVGRRHHAGTRGKYPPAAPLAPQSQK